MKGIRSPYYSDHETATASKISRFGHLPLFHGLKLRNWIS